MAVETHLSVVDDFQAIQHELPGSQSGWLQALRADAAQLFTESGFPSIREEEWRYTNVSAIEKKRFSPVLTAEETVDVAELKKSCLDDCWTIVLLNGRFNRELSNLAGLPAAVTVESMAQALENQSQQLEDYLGQAVSNAEHNFIAFNTAWFTDGVFIHVPSETVLEKPIQILHWVSQADFLANTRHVIALEDNAKATVIESFVGEQPAYLNASVAEIFLAEQSGLTHYKVQQESKQAWHFGGLYIKQAQNSRFEQHNFAFGSLLARTDIHTDLQTAAECDLNGLFLGLKRQHLDNHTRINHLKPDAVSREQYKGVLDQRARGVFQGRVIVAENAQKTDSEMSNQNLLLSDHAEIDTKPQLEIYADDVKCAHGVTVGQLDEKSIFYLRARCIDEETARHMLTFAFANQMVKKVPVKSLHDWLLALLLQRFPQQGIEAEWL